MIQRTPNALMFAGDWHKSIRLATMVINHAKKNDVDTIMHVGDFGIWHMDKKYLNTMNDLLEKNNMHLYFVDGNHENFDLLYEKRFNDDGTRFVRDRISYLPRGYRWNWRGVSFLALGGAKSIDIKHRVVGKSYWLEETINNADIAKSIEGGPVDVLISHDSPASAPNSIVDNTDSQLQAMRSFGPNIVYQCSQHRKLLQEVTDVVTPRLIVHGHYHKAMSGYFRHNDQNKTTAYVIGLDQGYSNISNHTHLLDFAEFEVELTRLRQMV